MMVAGCAHRAPDGIRLANVQPVTPVQARNVPERFENVRVRWGGNVVNVENRERETLIEVLTRPLESDGYPDSDGAAGVRFLTRIPGFVDPSDYAADRLVTVVGRITGTANGLIGEYAYRYVLVDADRIHLWPGPTPEPCCPYYPYYDPWYRPWWRGPYR